MEQLLEETLSGMPARERVRLALDARDARADAAHAAARGQPGAALACCTTPQDASPTAAKSACGVDDGDGRLTIEIRDSRRWHDRRRCSRASASRSSRPRSRAAAWGSGCFWRAR